MTTEFYEIRIFKKGEIEIFRNVFTHEIHVQDHVPKGIELKYSSSKNTGLYTHSVRTMEGVYDVQIIPESEMRYRLIPDDQGIKILIHG